MPDVTTDTKGAYSLPLIQQIILSNLGREHGVGRAMCGLIPPLFGTNIVQLSVKLIRGQCCVSKNR